MKKILILQSNYIPWKGYFDMINMVDEFIIFDDVQYTRRDWRNRNQIKTLNGLLWLTIPVEVKGKYFQKINETLISDPLWKKQHWKIIQQNYAKSRYFKNYKDIFEDLYLNCEETHLSKINIKFINTINSILGINTKITWSNDYRICEGKNERLIELCKQAGGDTYLSGEAAKSYIDGNLFKKEGISVEWMDYNGYKQYEQLYPPFTHYVSIIDLLFNEGENSKSFFKSFNNK